MSAKQIDIAARVGLDVSSVNKILNKTPGPIFAPATIKRVFDTAKRMGYDFDRPTKGSAVADLKRIRHALVILFLGLDRKREIRKGVHVGVSFSAFHAEACKPGACRCGGFEQCNEVKDALEELRSLSR